MPLRLNVGSSVNCKNGFTNIELDDDVGICLAQANRLQHQMSNRPPVGFPKLFSDSEEGATVPMTLQELPKQVQFDRSITVISRRHLRVAKSIKIFWGHRDCGEYLHSLILKGGDGLGNARVGFSPEVITALFDLLRLTEGQ
jgi:hypothetical protein